MCICYGALYQFPPLCSSVDGILLRVSGIVVSDGTKNGQQGEDSLEVELLVCRVQVMVLRLVWASRLGEALAKTEDLSKPEWCFVRWLQFSQNLEELTHGVRPGHADILVLEHEEIARPRLRMYPPKFMWIAVISTKVGPRLRSGRAFAE